MHLLVDSAGLRLCGTGGWLQEKHGTKTRRSPRKLHIGLDAGSGQIAAASLTAKKADDGAGAGLLLDQVTSAVASFTHHYYTRALLPTLDEDGDAAASRGAADQEAPGCVYRIQCPRRLPRRDDAHPPTPHMAPGRALACYNPA